MSFDFDFSPSSYFSNLDFTTRIKSRVDGQKRKEEILKKSSRGFVPPALMKNKLSVVKRSERSALHPHHMGGEYLPGMKGNEIEICRIVVQSTTLDVIAIRVQLNDGIYFYSVNDEYEIFDYQLPYPSSEVPLTMKELIEQIDNCLVQEKNAEKINYSETGLIKPILRNQLSGGSRREDLVDFIAVESQFYPRISEYYTTKINEYLLKR